MLRHLDTAYYKSPHGRNRRVSDMMTTTVVAVDRITPAS
jgi:hypothetical protein